MTRRTAKLIWVALVVTPILYLVTRDARLLGLVALDVLALILLFPTEGRWRQLLPAPSPAGGSGAPGVR